MERKGAMSYVAYLKVEGIAGDCADAAHKDWMAIDSFSQNLVGPQERGGRAHLSDVALNRLVDRATPLLARATAEERPFQEAVLELCTNEGSKPKFMEIRFENVRISNYAISGAPQSDARTPYESFMLHFEKVEWLYFPNAFVPGHEKEPVVCRTAWATDAMAAL
jgi:type VI secretion system Hcp family effector